MITVTSQEIEMRTNYDRVPSIEDSGERIFLLAYNCILLLSSLLGDTIILVATTKYTAIKLHAVIVVIIQHLAVCDLLAVVLKIVPTIISLVADDWVLGDFYGHLQASLGSFVQGVTLVLTCGMSTVKLVILKRPLRANTWKTKEGHLICVTLWLFRLLLSSPSIFVDIRYLKNDIVFDYAVYHCVYNHRSPKTPAWFHQVYGISLSVVMTIAVMIMLVTSTLILMTSKKCAKLFGESLRLEGVMTVLATVIIFLASYLPYSITVVVSSFQSYEKYPVISATATRVLYSLVNINIAVNFFIYALTIDSFKRFLNRIYGKLFSSLRTF